MMAADNDFHDNSIIACMALLHIDAQIGQRLEQAVIICPHAVMTTVSPWFVIVTCRRLKCSQDAFQVVLVFSRDVFVVDELRDGLLVLSWA